MAVKVAKKVKYVMALCIISQVVYICILHGKFYGFFKKCTTFALCHSIIDRAAHMLFFRNLYSHHLATW